MRQLYAKTKMGRLVFIGLVRATLTTAALPGWSIITGIAAATITTTAITWSPALDFNPKKIKISQAFKPGFLPG